MTEEDDWAWRFTGLNKYEAGKKIVYTITEDVVPGYTTAVNGYNVTNTHTPEEKLYTVTIRYWYLEVDGETAAPTFHKTYHLGDTFDVMSPRISGWIADQLRVSGTVTGNLVFDVIYTPHLVRLIIDYIYKDGSTAAPTHTSIHTAGDPYNVVSPVIPGYRASIAVCKGVMPDHDVHLVVIYVPWNGDITIEDDPVPLGIGSVERNVGDCFE